MEKLSTEQSYLLQMIKDALTTVPSEEAEGYHNVTAQEWERILLMARKHAVLSLMYEIIKKSSIPEELFHRVEKPSRETVMQNYKLLYLTNYLVKLLEKEGISILVLKGVATAALYPYPELRKSGDIDLLLIKKAELEKASEVLEQHAFQRKEQQSVSHHVTYLSEEGIHIELHTLLVEPFDHNFLNEYLNNLTSVFYDNCNRVNIIGSSLPVLGDSHHAYYLLIHMLQHYLRSGFGLKLLCDWVVFWNGDISDQDKENFLRLINESGIKGFADYITKICIEYLGLKEEKVVEFLPDEMNEKDINILLLEILEAEEYGGALRNRLVALRSTSPVDYLREFHHQMHLNYPKLGEVSLLWPILWCSTLIKFLTNNRNIREITMFEVLRKTHSRSKVNKRMRLFNYKKKRTYCKR